MRCLNDEQLNMLAMGRLNDELREALLHVGSCADCRERLKLAARPAVVSLGESVFGMFDCPEYEALSDFIDGTLPADAKRSVETHLCACELCYSDVQHLSDMRAAAHLRGPVTVTPVAAKRARGFGIARWRLALGGVVAGMILAVVLRMPSGMPTPPGPNNVAKLNPPAVTNKVNPGNPPRVATHTPEAPKTTPKPAEKVAAKPPAYTTVLRDGKYSLIQSDGRVSMMRGSKPASALEASLEAAIQEKIRTGKVKITEPVKVAMANTGMRDKPGGYVAPPTAPELKFPVSEVVQSATPGLRWSKVDMAERYHVVVTDPEGNRVFEAITDRNSAVPDLPLKRGTVYRWYVGVRFGEEDQWTDSNSARFSVLSERGLALIESAKNDMPGSRLALAVAYESVGLYAQARTEYSELERENSRSKLAARLSKSVQDRE